MERQAKDLVRGDALVDQTPSGLAYVERVTVVVTVELRDVQDAPGEFQSTILTCRGDDYLEVTIPPVPLS